MSKQLIALSALFSSLFIFQHELNAIEQYQKKDQYFKALSPEQAIKTIEVPDGYQLQCVASEPMVQEPASFVFDEDGAMYVCEWLTYMQDEYATNQLEPISRVVKLVDTDGDGVMDKRSVFIDNVILPRTVLPLKDRVLVNFTNEKNVWAYFDDNNDGVSDRRELAYNGGEIGGNIEHQESGMLWNLDNWIYCHTHRFKYKNGKMTIENYPKISQWGLARDDDGHLYGTWAGGGNPLHSFQVPAGYTVVPYSEHAPNFNIPNAICKVEDQSSGGYDHEKDRVLQHFSAPCGQTVLRSSIMPEFYGHAITPEPVGRLIRMSKIKRDEFGGRVAHNAFPESEFIRSSDPFFRPVWSESGPDGCLYFSDMYRGIIQEKNWFPHEGDHIWVKRYKRIKEWGMLKVFRHGRIYRLVPKDKQPTAVPKLKNLASKDLVKHLESPNGWTRDTAQKLIVYNQDKSVVPALKQLFERTSSVNTRVVALWCLEGLESMDKTTLFKALNDPQDRIRTSGIRLAEAFLKNKDQKVETKLISMIEGASKDVALQLVLSLDPKINTKYADLQVRIQETHKEKTLVHHYLQAKKDEATLAELGEIAKNGAKLYNNFCFTCHGKQGNGTQVAGSSKELLAPSFRNHEWFQNKRTDFIARVMLKGETGPIDGKTYGEGNMIPLEHMYDDQQMSDLINYIGRRWNGWRSPIKPSEIAKVRQEVKDRKKPYTRDELEPKVSKANIIAPSALEAEVTWKYTTEKPSADWMKPDYDDSDWLEGVGGFGTHGTANVISINTIWDTTNIWVRRTIKLDKESKKPYLNILYDEDFTLYINGQEAMSKTGYLTEYQNLPLSPAASKLLKLGENVFAAKCRQTSGGQYFDFGLVEPDKNGILASVNQTPKPPSPPKSKTTEYKSSNKDAINVLITGGGGSHDFITWYGHEDSKTLHADKLASTYYTEEMNSVAPKTKTADVLFLSHNQGVPSDMRSAIFDHLNAGKGLMINHSSTWYNWGDWPEYNRDLLGGGTRSHENFGEFEVIVKNADHPIMKSVPSSFRVKDELYRYEKDLKGAEIEVLAIGKSLETGKEYPLIFIVKHPNAKIVANTLGHDEHAHKLKAYKTILKNTLKWMQWWLA